MSTKKKLVIFPQSYPYKGGDQVFLSNELYTLTLYFDEIVVIHFKNFDSSQMKIPNNVEVKCFLNSKSNSSVFDVFDIDLFRILWSELRRTSLIIWLKYFRFFISSFLDAKRKIKILKNNRLLNHDSKFYSFWMNENAFLLAVCMRKGLIKKFFFRLHGFDLYDEIRPDNFIPFRDFNFSQVTKAFTVSRFGYNYLIPKLKHPNKLENAYLGTYDIGLNPLNPDKNVIVSCSSINKQKRVHLIVDALSNIKTKNILWVHIGEKGDWGSYLDLKKYANSKLPSNISFDAKGYMTNKEILQFYKSFPISAFVHLSETEGGPSIACVEAISFGIPLIAAPNGGLVETINSKTGIVLSQKLNVNDVSIAIEKIFSNEYQNFTFREGVKQYWSNTFDAEKVNLLFKDKIIN